MNETCQLYPLQFVCSNLEFCLNLAEKERVYDQEAQIVVQELQELHKKWPIQWGKRDYSDVAITSPTRSQVSPLHEPKSPIL